MSSNTGNFDSSPYSIDDSYFPAPQLLMCMFMRGAGEREVGIVDMCLGMLYTPITGFLVWLSVAQTPRVKPYSHLDLEAGNYSTALRVWLAIKHGRCRVI
jgi:hypothetical protein